MGFFGRTWCFWILISQGGVAVARDPSFEWQTDACDAGEAPACLTLAQWRATGERGPKDSDAARALLGKACKAGLQEACLRVAEPSNEQQDALETACGADDRTACAVAWAKADDEVRIDLMAGATTDCDEPSEEALTPKECQRIRAAVSSGDVQAVARWEADHTAITCADNGRGCDVLLTLGLRFRDGAWGIPKDEKRAESLLSAACLGEGMWTTCDNCDVDTYDLDTNDIGVGVDPDSDCSLERCREWTPNDSACTQYLARSGDDLVAAARDAAGLAEELGATAASTRVLQSACLEQNDAACVALVNAAKQPPPVRERILQVFGDACRGGSVEDCVTFKSLCKGAADTGCDGFQALVDKEFRLKLAAGRTFTRDKRFREAVESFKDALRAHPDDAQALGGLGWAAFQHGNLIVARRATRAAIHNSVAPSTLGALNYNLGRIEEADGNYEDAVAAYTESVKQRPNKEAEKCLARATKAAEAAPSPD